MKKILTLFICIMFIFITACTNTSSENVSGNLNESAINSDSIPDDSIMEESSVQTNSSESSGEQSIQLAVPNGITISQNLIVWNLVPNAQSYNVKILPNNVIETTEDNFISLEPYFAANKELVLSVQAVAEEGSNFIDSNWSENVIFVIEGESVIYQKGIGSAVNLLTGDYTEFDSGTISIFDTTLFNRLRVTEYSIGKTDYNSTLYEGLDTYLLELGVGYSNKTSINASASPKLYNVKISGGYEFDIGLNYNRKSNSETSALFYDSEYYYTDRVVSLEYKDISKLSAALSQEFLEDARKLENGAMSAKEFIDKYGTNIVTAAIYGAKFTTHYELITNNNSVINEFSVDIKSKISAQVSGTIKGVDLGVQASTEENINFDLFISETSSDKHSKFSCSTIGGGAAPINASSLESVKSNTVNWASGISKENCEIIDVPDGSLLFVWDFLDSSYSTAKEILIDYFVSVCDDKYNELKDKINLYIFEEFDLESGTLTIDLSSLQTLDSADLSGFEHPYFDEETKVFTVYSAYNGIPVKKVVFKGRYNTRDAEGNLITKPFKSFAISFDDDWVEDIVLEFDSFAFEAPEDVCALDFSQTKSSNITISIVNKSSITGGLATASGVTGCTAINAGNKNLSIIGNSEDGSNSRLDVVGGNGAEGKEGAGGAEGENGKPGETGGAGGTAVIAYSLLVTNVDLDFTGGIGGQGGKGGWGNGAQFSPANGGKGGTGGAGGNALILNSNSELVVYNSTIKLTGGKGGKGGTGGNGSEYNLLTNRGKGGNGGTGGTGGNALYCNYYDNNELTSINLIAGEGGTGGDRGINQKESGLEGSNGAAGSSGLQLYYSETIEAVIGN